MTKLRNKLLSKYIARMNIITVIYELFKYRRVGL